MAGASLVPSIEPQILAARTAQASAAAAAAKTGGTPTRESKAREAAIEFESVFLASAFKTMFSGLDTNGPFGGGFGEEMFRELLTDEYAKNIAHSGGIGLSDQIMRDMLAMQEATL